MPECIKSEIKLFVDEKDNADCLQLHEDLDKVADADKCKFSTPLIII